MLKNHLKIAWRNILRNKIPSIVNILGLSLGICACIVIYIITSFEFSFDSFHPDKKQIYRVMAGVTEKTGDKLHFAKIPPVLMINARNNLSGMETLAGVIPYNAKISVADGDNPSKQFEGRINGTNYLTTVITEQHYFSIFKYKWLAGSAGSALDEPLTAVLTQSRAQQYFGRVSPDKMIGRRIVYDDSIIVSVTGIVKDWDKNTDLAFTDFISFSTIQSSFLKNKINTDSWKQNAMSAWVFTKITNGEKPSQVAAQLNDLVRDNADNDIKLTLKLEPISEMHFDAAIIENPIRTAHKPTLYTLVAIALFILFLAIINFINLSTAQSIQRVKEIGVRKVLGSNRTNLIFQFLAETFLLSLFAVLIALLLVNPVLALFRSFIPNGISFHLFEVSTGLVLLTIILTTTLLAGFYPAKVLSSYLPVFTLKGRGTQPGGEKWMIRKGLIVFQFTVSFVFIIGSIAIAKQLSYLQNKELGFKADAIVIIETPRGDSMNKISVLNQELKQINGIDKTAMQWLPPMTDNPREMKLKFKATDQKDFWVKQVAGDENYISLYEIKLLAGRNVSKSDTVNEFVINESLAKLLDDKDPTASIGKTLYWNDKPFPVVGLVADFHTKSLHDEITPSCIINRRDRQAVIAVKLASLRKKAGMIKKTLSSIENTWKQIYPAGTFKYRFYDESLELLYEKDQQTAKLVNVATAVTIFISCIGLFGLAFFTAERRTREISIRKILGATTINIAAMLSKDFVLLAVIGLFIASPIAWYFSVQWLESFAYRINFSWWMILLAGVAVILITLITVTFQAIRAAIGNPVMNLRTE